jgi:hypothetical protein
MGGMGGGGGGKEQGAERERQTWLQEEDEVWAEDIMPVTALGRPMDEEEEEAEIVDEWVAKPKRSKGGPPRPRTAPPVGWSPTSRR